MDSQKPDWRTSAHDFVRYALTIGALEVIPGGRKLKSERLSPYFFNSGLFCEGEALATLASAYANLCCDLPNGIVVFGPAYKGIVTASSTVLAAARDHGKRFLYAHDRKEEKDHGEGGVVVGAQIKDKEVVIADDVITTGGSAQFATSFIRSHRGKPVRCIIAFDRQERGLHSPQSAVQEFVASTKIPVCAIATLTDLIATLTQDAGREFPDAYAALSEINQYQRQYGTV